ncbi:AAA family ATPase [Pullulanibacillus sp. KACC 23026]|uniref:AAA family ATPase n=1 Tax=Pullulanibacillus sp. KACC 23026 TaxID=3028315 RepID=UPI0023B16408|nr:AAA family ATPase [Pullulanibacillus sp. KACC 23026]WEG11327.1 AAA family ATPase [Pullulanibacillus sp. KACC 23026]
MATLHLLIGLPGKCKTSFGQDLEARYDALHLNPADWQNRLLGNDLGDPASTLEENQGLRPETLKSLVLEKASSALKNGKDVIIDLECLTCEQKDEFHHFADELGVELTLHYVDIPEELVISSLKTGFIVNPEETFLIPEKKVKKWLETIC